MAITSRPQTAGFPLTIEISSGYLPKPSWIKISQVRTISVERLGKRLAVLPPEVVSDATDGLLDLIS